MSQNQDSHTNHHETHPIPPPRGNPIPSAEINTNPAAGRLGPIIGLPIPKNLDGKRDPSRNKNLNLDRLRRAMKGDEGVDTTNNTTSADPGEGTSGYVSTGIDEKENNVEELDEDDSDFELLDHPVMTPPDSPHTEEEAYATTSLLTGKVPPELVPEILDYAGYFPHQILAKREDKERVGNNGSRVYLTAKIPDFEAMDNETAGKGGKEGMGGRPGRVRRIAFRITSNDQGWSSYPTEKGTYKGSWTWLEVELWRKPEGDSQPTGKLLVQDEKSGESSKEEDGQPKDNMVKVGSWILQRNKHAEKTPTDHEIVWDWKEDELSDDNEEKWEPGVVEGWHKDGRLARNGSFVRQLRGGDELRIIMRAQYPGWSCTVSKAEVECWWAV